MIDLNVLLDVFQAREPWFADAQAIWDAHNRGIIVGSIAAHGLTNLFYILRRAVGTEPARRAVRSCLQTFTVISIGRPELEAADTLVGTDLEDNLVIACAIRGGLDAIVTRDSRGFAGSSLPVFTPAELLTRCSPNSQGS